MPIENEGYKWIRENFIYLKENICVLSLTGYLFQDHVISLDEKIELESEKSRPRRNDALLTLILRKLEFQACSSDVFNKFMSYLQKKHPRILDAQPLTVELYKSFDDFKKRKELKQELEDHKTNCDRLNMKINELEKEKENHKTNCDRLNLNINKLEKKKEDHKANCDTNLQINVLEKEKVQILEDPMAKYDRNLKINELEKEKEDHKAKCHRLSLQINELEKEKAKDKQIIRSLQINFEECIQMCHEQEDEIEELKNKILDMAMKEPNIKPK